MLVNGVGGSLSFLPDSLANFLDRPALADTDSSDGKAFTSDLRGYRPRFVPMQPHALQPGREAKLCGPSWCLLRIFRLRTVFCWQPLRCAWRAGCISVPARLSTQS